MRIQDAGGEIKCGQGNHSAGGEIIVRAEKFQCGWRNHSAGGEVRCGYGNHGAGREIIVRVEKS